MSAAATVELPPAAAREELCLDFVNTLCWRGRAAPSEGLTGVADLLGWLARSGSLPTLQVETLLQWAAADPSAAAALFAEAIALREAVYRLFAAAASGGGAADEDLAALNAALAGAPARRALVRASQGYVWAATPAATTAPALLAPVLWSAADLLTRLDRFRVRRCANDECLWLFLDHSKGGTRRWCDMAMCGNRAKARRHYERAKRAPAAPRQ